MSLYEQFHSEINKTFMFDIIKDEINENLTFDIIRSLFKVKTIIESKILKKNLFSGFNLYLSSIIPKMKNEKMKKKIDVYFFKNISL